MNPFGLIANGWNPSSQRLLSPIITYFPNEIASISASRYSKLLTFKWDFRFIPPQFFLIRDLGFYCHEMLRQFLKISDISLWKMSANSPSLLQTISYNMQNVYYASKKMPIWVAELCNVVMTNTQGRQKC